MIYGFPGNTQEYILSDAVAYIAERSDPAKIAIRTGRLDIITKAQESDPALRIHYAAKHASIANAWKKWQGEALGIDRRGTVAAKFDYETQFGLWSVGRPEYAGVVMGLRAEYDRIMDAYFAYEITRETLSTLPAAYTPEERAEECFARRKFAEQALWRHAFREYGRCPKVYRTPSYAEGMARYKSPEAYADALFEAVWEGSDSVAMQPAVRLREETKRMLDHISWMLGTKSLRNLNSKILNELYTTYIKGLREWDRERAFYPDANLTLRVAYGSVAGYEYADGEYHKPQTTLDGIIAKGHGDRRPQDRAGLLPGDEPHHGRQFGIAGAERRGRTHRHQFRPHVAFDDERHRLRPCDLPQHRRGHPLRAVRCGPCRRSGLPAQGDDAQIKHSGTAAERPGRSPCKFCRFFRKNFANRKIVPIFALPKVDSGEQCPGGEIGRHATLRG